MFAGGVWDASCLPAEADAPSYSRPVLSVLLSAEFKAYCSTGDVLSVSCGKLQVPAADSGFKAVGVVNAGVAV